MAQASTAGLILREAYAQGAFGADSGNVWFFTDAVTTGLYAVQSAMSSADPCAVCGSASEAPPAMTVAECAAAMRGTIGMSPVTDFSRMSGVYSEWKARYAAQNETAGWDPSNGGECTNGD